MLDVGWSKGRRMGRLMSSVNEDSPVHTVL